MRNNNYDYYSDWGPYAYPAGAEAASADDIMRKYRAVELSAAGKFPASGIPLLKRGSEVYVNDLTENTLIFGETGCKKSRCVIAPLIAMTTGAGESAFVTDVKGELSANPALRGFLEKKGIHTVYLDFRTFDKDCFSILEHPFTLYRSGQKRKAATEISRLLAALGTKFEHDDEPIWADQAVSYLSAIIEMIFIMGIEFGKPDGVNMLSLAEFANMHSLRKIAECAENSLDFFREKLSPENFAALENVALNPADKMTGSILGFVHSLIKPFASEPSLSEMLSVSSFKVTDIYKEPTCVFLIIPDETSAYDMVSGLLTDTFYTRLIEEYGRTYMGRSEPPCRVNFICDEFCNLHINDMKSKISASRSRCMRWFLVCQSKNQLETTYVDHAGTIIGNCRNTLFLQSSDKDLVNYICDLCGETFINEDGRPHNFVRPDMLRELRKERDYKEAVFIDGNTVFFTELPDIDSYEFLKRCAPAQENEAPESAGGKSGKVGTVFGIHTLINFFNSWLTEVTEDVDENDEDGELSEEEMDYAFLNGLLFTTDD